MPVTVAELDVIRGRLQRALDAVEHMTHNMVAGRAETQPDAFAVVGDDVVAGADLSDALQCWESMEPTQVQGWAVVRRFWAVRVPTDEDGDEIMQFETEADAKAFIASAHEPASAEQ